MKLKGSGVLPTCVIWDAALTAYNFGPGHPMTPVRLELTASLAEELGLFRREGVYLRKGYIASDAELNVIHDQTYIAAVRRASDGVQSEANHQWGLGTSDDPSFPGMHDASARIVGGSLDAVDELIAGRAVRAVNFAGGMHHAHSAKASGFCIYNDAAAAIRRLLAKGARRVAYVDIDAHHGDGTQSLFYDTPEVLTISMHESGVSLFPGTGFANEIGGQGAAGSAANIALPAYTGDDGWLRAFHSVVPQLLRAFKPEVIVSQHGCDSHQEDPLTHLKTTVDAQREVALSIAGLADELCSGRWLALGGGGYAVASAVPRIWSHLIAVVSGKPTPLRTDVPQRWRERVEALYGVPGPVVMNDDAQLSWRSWEAGYDPANAVDQAILATRKEIFPYYGLDPWLD